MTTYDGADRSPDVYWDSNVLTPHPGADREWIVTAQVTYYYQRVYDTVLAAWCYYVKIVLDPAPLYSETTPNHTNHLLTGAHDIVRAFAA